MAITISSQPLSNRIISAYSPIRYIVTSNDATISKVQAEIYLAGSLIKTIVHDPDITTTNQFTFDIQGIVKDNLTYDINSPTGSLLVFTDAPDNTLKTLYVIFNEVLLTAGLLVVQAIDYTSNTSYATNVIADSVSELTEYSADDSDKPFLTTAPANQNIFRNESLRLGYVLFSTGTYKGVIKQYQGAALLGTTTSASQTVTNKRAFFRLNTTYLSGLCDKMEVYLTDNVGNVISATRTYYIKQERCEDAQRFWFMNKQGDFDQFTFDGEYTEGIEIDSKDYKKINETQNATLRGLEQFRVDAFEKFSVASRPLTREEARWLKQLLYSPQVYVEVSGSLHPVLLTNQEKSFELNSNDLGRGMKVEYLKSNDLIVH